MDKEIEMFKYQMPDSFESYNVLPKADENPMTPENFRKMEEEIDLTDRG